VIPATTINRLRAEACRIITDPAASVSLCALAWQFLRQWSTRP